ncbi:Decoration protein [Salmonella enterica subsp. enterica serovar Bovismorbificans]|nr:Decoration protein [Salmonella enterica]EBW5134129.1 Decoration protein [Salmonella enterica subsp. enterica serovar Newport]ECC3445381.1 Decoration protein [Salmonella enterica subsp. enterica]ECJ2286650.1 Decoration protein [Salmonella enterica subsp. diarizonae]EDG5039765.1 Decoration protein [Salmonella enterica subsp. enterica serovar Bovismorbificans]
MANPNFTPSWPLYKDADGAYVSALPIKAIKYANDGSANAEFDGPYTDQYMSAQTVAVFNPEVGGYLFRSQYGELLYMSKTAFEAKYTSASGSVTNAETADKLSTARTITLTGAVTGSTSFDGSANVTIATTQGS